ncbi:MAG: glycosyltransferase family 2 protein [Terracidiphilus sp.]|jgi:glycosyltransferase involved in cell wall biosynthesis
MVAAHVARGTLLILSWFLALGWLWRAVAALRGMPTLPDLTRMDADALPPLPEYDGPHLSVVVPACNEEESIEATLRSLLASTGLRLEIIAVDDRSTDKTGRLMEAIAVEAAVGPHGLRVLHLNELPAGWLGKPHALAQGVEHATAPWLLFTDGDVSFAPHALELALRLAVREQADQLVLALTLVNDGMGGAAMQATAQALAQWSLRLWKVADPKARDFCGTGGFNMVRAEMFTRLGGFEKLRMEVVEDLTLGWTVKRAGGRSIVALGLGLVNIRWIQGIFGIVGNMEKNGFAVFRFRVGLALAACLGLLLHAVLPLAAIAAGGWTMDAGLLTYASIAMMFYANRGLSGVSPLAALLFAPATAIISFGILRSVVLTLWRDGVNWRGTHYPLSELRRNAMHWR